MNPRYLFIIEDKSSNLICPFKGEMFINGYLTEYIAVEDTGYQILLESGETRTCYVMLFDADKTQIATFTVETGVFQPYRTLYSATRYIRVLIPNPITPNECYFGTGDDFDSWWNNEVHPLWNNDIAMEYTKESQQEFFRKSLSGKVVFVKDDYDYIVGKQIDYKFRMDMFISYDNGKTLNEYWKGSFYWTDCEFDEDGKYVRVTPTTNDDYAGIMAALEKEYNMIDLLPTIEPIHLQKRPIIQTYIQSSVMSPRVGCFMGGNYWEQDATYETGINKITRTCHFDLNRAFAHTNLVFLGGGDVPPQPPISDFNALWHAAEYTQDGTDWWRLSFQEELYIYEWRQGGGTVVPLFTIYERSSGNVMWQGRCDYTDGTPFTIQGAGSLCDILVSFDVIDLIYARILTDLENVNGVPTYDIPEDDIIPDNRNYKRVIGIDVQDYIVYTNDYSSTPTKWGRHDVNEYYEEPQTTGLLWKPISPSAWVDNAYWLGIGAAISNIDEDGRTPIVLKNAYALEDVISLLLAKTGTGLTLHSGSFVSYKADNVYQNVTRKIFITPKSNMTNIEYDMAAQEAPISLKKILDMLRECYKAYWYVKDGELHIEHIYWFMTGGTYDPEEMEIGPDLTLQMVTRNGKAWAFGKSQYTFDKPDMAERYEFGWMDEQSAPFNGEPINIISGFIQKGKVEKTIVNDFSADVDYIMANPAGVSPDGFVLMAATYDGNWELPFAEISSFVELQNAYCAFAFLYRYYLYDLPSLYYRLGEGTQSIAYGVLKSKSQEVSFPCLNDPDMQKLVKTYIGRGQIEKLSINLSSRNGKATLKYNPYESV